MEKIPRIIFLLFWYIRSVNNIIQNTADMGGIPNARSTNRKNSIEFPVTRVEIKFIEIAM